MSFDLPETVTLNIDEILPYENNPRQITEEAVAAVKQSIELYGYVQPIVVDKQHVIIVGHTRHQALKELGVKKVPVYVSDLSEEKAKEYRLVDNRTGELAEWDYKALVMELREWDEALLADYFPDVDLEVGALNDVLTTDEDVERASDAVTSIKEAAVMPLTEIVCPSCFHTFKVKSASLPGLSHSDLDTLATQTQQR